MPTLPPPPVASAAAAAVVGRGAARRKVRGRAISHYSPAAAVIPAYARSGAAACAASLPVRLGGHVPSRSPLLHVQVAPARAPSRRKAPPRMSTAARLFVNPFSTAASDDDGNAAKSEDDDDNGIGRMPSEKSTDALLGQLEADTEAALRGDGSGSSGGMVVLELLDRWTGLQESHLRDLARADWSDPTHPTLRGAVRCADRVDDLVRWYDANANNDNANASNDGASIDELEPYRTALRMWGRTPTVRSGDRAAAVVDLWGNRYGGDMSRQPSIEAFDAVLRAYALSADVHVVHASPSEEGKEAWTGLLNEDGTEEKEEEEKRTYPDDKALSTLRLLHNLGDMYLAPTVSTVSYVVLALRRASRTPRGRNDGRNEWRARTAIDLVRGLNGEAAALFGDTSGDVTDEVKKHQHSYIQACCDALSMSVRSLPIQEAIEQSRYFLDEIDIHAFGHGSGLVPSLRGETDDKSSTLYILGSTLDYVLHTYKDRATVGSRPYSPSVVLEHIAIIAQASLEAIARANRWGGVLSGGDFLTFEQICFLSTRPNIVNDERVDAARYVVPLILDAESMLWTVKEDLPMESFQYLMSSWASLSGVVRSVPSSDGHAPTSPADRATQLLKYKVEKSSMRQPDQTVDLTADFNTALFAWSRARAGVFGAEKGLELFDEMGSNGIHATPDETTYGHVLRCLRYANDANMAIKAESILAEMRDEGCVKPTARHYGTVISAFAKSGHRDAAKWSKTLLKMLLISYHDSKDEALLPNSFMFCEVINAIGRDRVDPLNKVQKIKNLMRNLVDLYEETGQDILLPNEVVFDTAIRALSKIRDGEDALDALELVESLMGQMRSYSIRPNEKLVTTVINCYSNAGRPEDAELLLREMEAMELRPTHHSYNSAILAWAKAGNADRCNALLDEMLDKYAQGDGAMKPNAKTYVSVINALWKSGGPNVTDEAIDIVQLMEDNQGDKDLAPTAAAYTSVINCMARSDLPDKAVKAKEMLERAKHRGRVKPDISLYTSVLNACAYTKGSESERQKALAIAADVEAELQGNPSLRWDSIAFNTILQVYGYLIIDESERNRLSAGLLKRCCEQGLVSKPLLGTLKRFAPKVYYGLGTKSMFTKDGHIKFGKLPSEWTRNTRRSRR
jgi:pentatricopeptide repeat protein